MMRMEDGGKEVYKRGGKWPVIYYSMDTVPLLPNGVPSVRWERGRVSFVSLVYRCECTQSCPSAPFPALSRHCAPSTPLGCCVNLLTPEMPGSHSGAKCSPAYEYSPSRALSRLLQRQGAMSRPVKARTCCVNQCPPPLDKGVGVHAVPRSLRMRPFPSSFTIFPPPKCSYEPIGAV
jgi:hypothetical protein